MQQIIQEAGLPKVFQNTFTVVIPAYNEEEVIGEVLEEICSFVASNHLDWSVIVSLDGDDDTDQVVSSYSSSFPFVSMMKSDERSGKGAAIKRVLNEISSEYVIIMDADNSMNFQTITNNLHLLQEYDGIIFSRYNNGNRIPFIRRFLSKGFNTLVRASLGITIRDTQSGYKAFESNNFITAMNKVGSTNTFWDVSLLYYLNREKAKIKEIQCEYNHRKESKFHPLGEILGQGLSLIAFRLRHSRFYK
jgi:glycosyltransferase involved in cell wall biosynthesis